MPPASAPLPARALPRFAPLLVVAALGLGAAPPAPDQSLGPVSPAAYFAPLGYGAKEFTLVRQDGWFHLFYIRQNLQPGAPTEQSLGHAISRDLYTWTEQDTILPILPGTYEGSQIWAPHLVRAGDTWHLFYPAMHDDPARGILRRQAITAATSTDLYHWTRRPDPLFDNSLFPWAYHDTTSSVGEDCRDPFVWWDAPHGEWVMYVATRPAFQPQSMVIGIAVSTDLEHWTDAGYVPITLPASSFSDVAESPTILEGDTPTLVLLWTTDSGNSLTYGTSTDALTGWAHSSRLRFMLGYTTVGWWGSESLVDGARRYFGSIDDTWLQFWDLRWTARDTFALAPPDSGQILGAGFDRDAAAPGDTARVIGRMVHGAGRSLPLTWVRRLGTVADTLSGADFGLPDTLAMDGDSTAVPFEVRAALTFGETNAYLTVSATGGDAPPDTLHVIVPDPPYDDPPLEPDPPPLQTRLIVVLRPAEVRFVRDDPAGPWTCEVFDVRGRRLWRDEAAAGQRTLVWRPGAAGAGGGARVGAGIYFARVSGGGRRPERLKVPLLARP